MRLEPEAVLKFIEIADTPTARIGARVLDQFFPQYKEQYLSAQLLQFVGVNPVIAGMDDHEDALISVEWSDKHGGYGYFNDQLRWVSVPEEDLQVYDVNFPVFLSKLKVRLDIHAPNGVVALIPDYLWEIGDVALPGRKQRLSLWFGRCLDDAEIFGQIFDYAHRRPLRTLRPFLTTTDQARHPHAGLPGHMIISICDVLDYAHGFAIDPAIFAARLHQTPLPETASALALSPDGDRLTINGSVTIEFNSDIQITIIKLLVADFQAGKRSRARDILSKAGSSALTLKKAFGPKKWAELEPWLKTNKNSLWSFEL
ncbi:MAG: hypothetical protein EBT10_01545 [Methylocystaceae bacterium]|nr:hypothetical protein [Methylocystaceae bacterium]